MVESVRYRLQVGRFALIAAVGLSSAWAAAGEPQMVSISDSSTLADLVAYAEQQSPRLRAARHRYLATEEGVQRAGGLPDPQLRVGLAIVPIETRVGPQHGQLALTQTLPGNGKRDGRKALAGAAAETERRAYQRERYRLAFDVADAYYELYLLERSIAVTRDNRDILVHLEQVVRRAYETGDAAYADLIRTHVEIGKLENDLRSLTDGRRAVEARLNAVLHRPTGSLLPEPKVSAEPVRLLPEDELRQRLASSSPELSVLEADIERSQRQIELAGIEDRVDWSLSLAWLPTGSAIDPSTPDSGKDPLIAGVSLNLPLWRKKHRAAERQAAESRAAAVERRAAVQDRLSDRLETVLYRFRNADREIRLYRDTLLPKAEQSFEASQAGLRTGSVGVLDLMDTQRVLLQFQLSYERALTQRAVAVAELRMLLGADVLGGGA